jgi:hypothetical protein
MRRRRSRLGRRRRFAGAGIRIVSRVRRQRRTTDYLSGPTGFPTVGAQDGKLARPDRSENLSSTA